ncbi:MAG: hypothetical protein CL666_14925 [Balneola sp.]|nr:hypothetical protein [Balneola sp.]|tara:strand:- start:11115 stop:12398 length:1284 start_codon:yes stop_codon:yes gene_type:complete
MKTKILITIGLFLPALVFGRQGDSTLSLQEVYDEVQSNYPVAEKQDLQQKITALKDQIARSGIFPEISLHADATYQSEVTTLPFSNPGITTPELSKDHYSISMEVSQPIYDGGLTNSRRKLTSGESEVEDSRVEVTMWEIRSQAQQVYFGILNLQKRQATVSVLMQDLEEQLESVQTKVKNGVMLPGSAMVLKAELLKVRQSHLQFQYEIKAAYEVLGELMGRQIKAQPNLSLPKIDLNKIEELEITRPELKLFEARSQVFDLKQDLTLTDRNPKVSAFAKGAYGRPGFNVFDDDLHPYWMVGVRASWSFRNWDNAGKQVEVEKLQQKKVRLDEQAFLIGVRAELAEISKRIEQSQEQMILDEQILELREQVAEEKKNQLEQGVITATEYISELNQEAQARLNVEIRKLQLIQYQIEYLTKKGISWN